MLLWIALGAFLTAACGGAYLTVLLAQEKKLPWIVTLLHGVLGALGLVLLLVAALAAKAFGAVWIALIVLVCAALGGFLNLLVHMKRGKPILAVALIHGVVALIGAGVLVFAILNVTD